jgi:hypothetical protein
MTTTTSKIGKITLTKLKINRALSEETECFSATICLDGKPIGTCGNRGHGSDNEYFWTDREAGKRLREYAQSLPDSEYEGMTLPMDLDILIGDIMEEIEVEKQHRRWCKTKLVYRLKGDEKDTWRTFKPKTTPVWTKGWKAAIEQKHGDKLEEILNQRFGDPVN